MADIRLRGNLNIVPTQATETLDIGQANRRFNNIYAKTIVADSTNSSGTTALGFELNSDSAVGDSTYLRFHTGDGVGTTNYDVVAVGAKKRLELQGAGLSVADIFYLGVETQNTNVSLGISSSNIQLVDGSSGAFTITLPAVSGFAGAVFTFKRIDNNPTNIVTIATDDGETIDGASTDQLVQRYDLLRIVCDGNNWLVV